MAYDAFDESESADAPLLGGRADTGGRQLVNWLFPVYTLLIVAGIFVLRSEKVLTGTDQGMNVPQSVLSAVDAATLTGFRHTGSIVPKAADLQRKGQVVVLALTVVGSLFSMIVGGIAVSRILRLPFRAWHIVAAAFLFECGVGAATFFVLREPSGDSVQEMLTGLSRGIGAFGNYAGSLANNPLDLRDWRLYAVVFPLAVLGGLGVTVLLELLLVPTGRRLSTHARTVLGWTFGLYIAATFLFAAIQWAAAGYTRDPDRMRAIWASSSAMAIVTRTAGISEQFGYAFPRAMEWIMMLLMLIGASPGGTGGGVKTTTFAALAGGARRLLRGQNPGRQLGIAMTWVGGYLAMLLLAIIALLRTEPQSGADRVLVLAISALSNVGLSHDRLSMSMPGMFVLAALMLAGRLAPLIVLWWMADTTDDAELAVG